MENVFPLPMGFDPWTVQSIGSCFTNYTILANKENFAVINGNESFICRNLFVSFSLEYFYCIENFFCMLRKRYSFFCSFIRCLLNVELLLCLAVISKIIGLFCSWYRGNLCSVHLLTGTIETVS